MKPQPFSYERPADLSDAVQSLSDGSRNAMAIAGGQSLIALLNLRLATPQVLVDLRDIPQLREVHESRSSVFLGAAVTHAQIEDGEVPDPSHRLMARTARSIAYRSIRHRGTIGGSVALADPAADWPACLMALDAQVTIAGTGGQRKAAVNDLIDGAYTTSLAAGEIIVGFEICKLGATARWGHSKLSRKSGSYAESLAIALLDSERGRCRIVLVGAAPKATALALTQEYVARSAANISEAELHAAVRADLVDIAPDCDSYLARCHHAMVARAVSQACRGP